MAEVDFSKDGVIPGDWFMDRLKKANSDRNLALWIEERERECYFDIAIENQVELDALRLERKIANDARRAALSPEAREVEDLKLDLFCLEWGIS